ncbi:MAG: adenosine deaminase [Epsilonproteobacteria bacterium]|nr:adenosine deaminase [Campylobacterota bacterium]
MFLFSLVNLPAKGNLNISNSASNMQTTSKFYESLLKDDNEAFLTLFLTQMPKGGDLHHHFSGSIYAETYLDWISKKGWYIDKCTLHIVKDKNGGKCELLTPAQVLQDNLVYRKLLSAWSDKDFKNHYHEQAAPDANFFDTFSYFGAISHEYIARGLKILKNRALKENLSYIETMIGRVYVNKKDYFNKSQIANYDHLLVVAKTQKDVDKILEKITKIYLKNKKFNTTVFDYISKLNSYHLGIDDSHFLMRFQTSAVRVLDPLSVFTNLLAGYEAAKKSPLIVGVNILAPENNPVALADYTLHMRMYNYLLRLYPKVHRALHAGELTIGMVRPKNLTFHIRQAVEIARAERIGHGVDLPYEDHPLALLKEMKKKVAVEINFTSNQFILGVKGDQHPYLIYSMYGVPIVICTDDSGVSRDNLSHEYLILASRYHPTYARVKKYVYNSIKYSFLNQKEKVKLQKDLDVRFQIFEKKMAMLYKKLLLQK